MRWKILVVILASLILAAIAAFVLYPHSGISRNNFHAKQSQQKIQNSSSAQKSTQNNSNLSNLNPDNIGQTLVAGQKIYTHEELLALASGNSSYMQDLPLGDGKYTLQGPEKGYIYYCKTPPSTSNPSGKAPWISGNAWNASAKPTVEGKIYWKNATFSDIISGLYRIISGNGLPYGYPTGIFPIAKTDPAHQYDGNPNHIGEQNLSLNIPIHPIYSNTPNCLRPGGEIGMMLSGVPLFDGMDAGQRDAAAHEVQDLCNGHPDGSNEYHYHDLSSCFKNISVNHILGYALDGFPITGPEVAPGKFLTTTDLGECHGITSQITDENGNTYVTYHYVMTFDFPYSISCYRGTPVSVTGVKSAIQSPGTPQGNHPPQI